MTIDQYMYIGQYPFERAKRSIDYVDYIRELNAKDNWGKVATPHEYPWVVLLQDGCESDLLGGFSICGGALISPKLVLSAGHCLNCDPNPMTNGYKAYALLGAHEWRGGYEDRKNEDRVGEYS